MSVLDKIELAAAPSPASWAIGAARAPPEKSRMAETTAGVKCILDGSESVLEFEKELIRVVEFGGNEREECAVYGER